MTPGQPQNFCQIHLQKFPGSGRIKAERLATSPFFLGTLLNCFT